MLLTCRSGVVEAGSTLTYSPQCRCLAVSIRQKGAFGPGNFHLGGASTDIICCPAKAEAEAMAKVKVKLKG